MVQDFVLQKSCAQAFSNWKYSCRIFHDEWSFPYYMGKLVWKLKEDGYAEKALDLFAQANQFADLHEGGLIDPLYKLHSTRLKLLNGGCTDWALLTRYGGICVLHPYVRLTPLVMKQTNIIRQMRLSCNS